jgi:glycosyltransferase involved in cell wall biosynthesis
MNASDKNIKCLILAYDFPPYNSIGAQRPLGWYKYLHFSGIYPIVVTRHWDAHISGTIDCIKPTKQTVIECQTDVCGTLVRVPFKPNLRDKMLLRFGTSRYTVLRKILTVIFQLFEFHFGLADNKKCIYKAASNYIKSNRVDIIIATGEPFILFKYASKLSKKYKLPWIADYRDGWSTNYNRKAPEKLFYRIIERRLLASSSQIITVSEAFANEISQIVPRKLVSVVKNGYFPEKFESITITRNKKLTIAFAGTLYPYQPIEMFAEGLAMFKGKSNCILKFIGADFYPEQSKRINNAFLRTGAFLETTGRLPHIQAIEQLASADILLLPASSRHPQIYAKVFDYLALKKPIILFEDDKSSLSDIINTTQSGYICANALEIAAVLDKLYLQWETHGHIQCCSSNIEQYSRKEQTRLLAEILITAAGKR